MILHGVEMWPAASWHTLQMARQDEDFMLWVRRERRREELRTEERKLKLEREKMERERDELERIRKEVEKMRQAVRQETEQLQLIREKR